MAVLPLVLTAVGTVIGAVGAIREGQARSAAQETNARIAEVQAGEARIKTQEQARLARLRLERLKGKQRGRFAAGGVLTTAGTPLLVEAETELEGEREIALDRRAGEAEANILTAQASGFRTQARAATTAGFTRAGTTLLGGAVRSFDIARNLPRTRTRG